MANVGARTHTHSRKTPPDDHWTVVREAELAGNENEIKKKKRGIAEIIVRVPTSPARIACTINILQLGTLYIVLRIAPRVMSPRFIPNEVSLVCRCSDKDLRQSKRACRSNAQRTILSTSTFRSGTGGGKELIKDLPSDDYRRHRSQSRG